VTAIGFTRAVRSVVGVGGLVAALASTPAATAHLAGASLLHPPAAGTRAGASRVRTTGAPLGIAGAPLRLGTQTLTRCGSSPPVYCGRLAVPLDYGQPAGPQISIAYRFYPATAPAGGRAAGTVVPVEGGPGFPSIGSASFSTAAGSGGYSAMYGPLLDDWNMLVVDNRGTGASTPLYCRALQDFSGPTGGEAFQQAAGACAAALNHRWRYPDGEWVHASDLFTSAPAAEDLAAVITALGVGPVDLYGDSYGSFFAQVFAARFPGLLRSLTLDSTYETIDLDPWYRSTIQAMPADFDAVCSRWTACAQAAPGGAWARVVALSERLRASPIEGVVPGPEGARERVSMSVVGLVDLVNDAAGDPRIYRELDASARALLDANNPAPLLRLYAQRLAEDEAYFGGSAREYSVELYLAVSCLDYPQLFDMSSSPAARAAQLAAAEAALAAGTFSPFGIEEWIAQDQNTEAYTACLDWPSPTIARPPVEASPPLLPPALPVLVLGGELDTWTPPAGVPRVLAQLGGHARFIELANSTHVVGEGDTTCGSELVREFVAEPQTLDSLDAACAASVPPIHAVGIYATRLAEEQPLEAAPGSSAPSVDLQLAAAAVTTAGEAIARYQAIEARVDHGLNGGTVSAGHNGAVLTLHGDRLVPEVAVAGTVRLSAAAGPEEGELALATLTVTAPGIKRASFTATWTTAGADARAQVIGRVGQQPVAGSLPAP